MAVIYNDKLGKVFEASDKHCIVRLNNVSEVLNAPEAFGGLDNYCSVSKLPLNPDLDELLLIDPRKFKLSDSTKYLFVFNKRASEIMLNSEIHVKPAPGTHASLEVFELNEFFLDEYIELYHLHHKVEDAIAVRPPFFEGKREIKMPKEKMTLSSEDIEMIHNLRVVKLPLNTADECPIVLNSTKAHFALGPREELVGLNFALGPANELINLRTFAGYCFDRHGTFDFLRKSKFEKFKPLIRDITLEECRHPGHNGLFIHYVVDKDDIENITVFDEFKKQLLMVGGGYRPLAPYLSISRIQDNVENINEFINYEKDIDSTSDAKLLFTIPENEVPLQGTTKVECVTYFVDNDEGNVFSVFLRKENKSVSIDIGTNAFSIEQLEELLCKAKKLEQFDI